MKEPVLAQDGYTYERISIENHIKSNGVSPYKCQPLMITGLVPNRALMEEIALRRNEYSLPSQIYCGPNNDGKSYTELYSTVLNATKAEYHTNASNNDETIVHLTLPKSSIKKMIMRQIIFACVIDVSGSMAAEATYHDAEVLEKHTGLIV